MSAYEQKYLAAMAELEAAGVKVPLAASFVQSVARKAGLPVRPPYYSSYWRTAVSLAFYFGPVWGVAMWFISWRADGVSVSTALGTAAFAGVLFGLIMGLFYARNRRKHALSRWADL